MKRNFYLICFCCLCLFLFAPQVFGNTQKEEPILRTAFANNVGPMNPHLYDPNQMFAQMMIYDPLVRYTEEGITPHLAASWKISADATEYIFTLKENVSFSDGTTFNAQAVVQNFDAIMANKQRHAWLPLIDRIENYEARGENVFVLKLKTPYLMTLEELSLPRPFRMLSPSALIDGKSHEGIIAPIGTGPYMLQETKLGQYDIFARNESYHGEKPAFAKIKILVLPDPHSRIIALETDKIDVLVGDGSFSVEDFVRLAKNPEFVAEKSTPRLTNMLVMNTNRGITQDVFVRKAISHAINKKALVDYILLGQDEIAHTLYNPHLPFCDLDLVPYHYDMQKAIALLEQGGYAKKGAFFEKDGKVLSLDLYYMGTSAKEKSMAEVVQADLMSLGIQVNLHAEEYTLLSSIQMNGTFDMIFHKTWGVPYDPHAFTSSMLVVGHADYRAQQGLSQKEELDNAIKQIPLTLKSEDVQALYHFILTTLHEEAVYFPISYELDFALYKKKSLQNFAFGEFSMEHMFHVFTPTFEK